MGAPEVLQLGQNFMHLIGAKRVLDVGLFGGLEANNNDKFKIGMFTGASALAWALALPEDGEVSFLLAFYDLDFDALITPCHDTFSFTSGSHDGRQHGGVRRYWQADHRLRPDDCTQNPRAPGTRGSDYGYLCCWT